MEIKVCPDCGHDKRAHRSNLGCDYYRCDCENEPKYLVVLLERDEARSWAIRMKRERDEARAQLAAANERAEIEKQRAKSLGAMIGVLEGQLALLRLKDAPRLPWNKNNRS